MDLQEAYREARKILKETAAGKFQGLPDFAPRASQILETIYSSLQNDIYFAHIAAESIPRIFAADVPSGYSFFHDRENLLKSWKIYNKAAKILNSEFKITRKFSKHPPYKIACITDIFSDYIGPCKDVADLALYLDKNLFEVVFISTNQFDTIKRLNNTNLSNFSNTATGRALAESNIKIISIPEQENILDLTRQLIRICADEEIDIAVANSSMFNFPEACLAASGAVGAFFDFHRGFPLYADGVDAILHWLSSTREKQLGLWIENGGKVIDYNYLIKVPDLPKLPEKNDDAVFFITASNYLQQRLSPEFCAIVSKLLKDLPNTHYQLIGACVPENIKKLFDPSVSDRLEFIGPLHDPIMILAYFVNADIYLNEFPVGGGRVVLEAMSAYLPVAAMKCGDLHVENIGAEQVGDYAVKQYSPPMYYEFVRSLAESGKKRFEVGLAMRRRAESVYDFKKNVAVISEKMLEIYKEKLIL